MKEMTQTKAALSQVSGSYEGSLFVPAALEHSHRIASGKSPGVVCDSFPPGRWAAEVVSSAFGEKKQGEAGTESMQRVLIE